MTRVSWALAPALIGVLAIAGCGQREPRQHELGRQRAQIRPTDGTGWQNNGYGAVTVEHHDPPGGKIRVHYTREGDNAVPSIDANSNNVPDFVESFGEIYDEAIAAITTKLGFRPPLSDETYHDRPDYGGDGRFDVYLQDVGKPSDGYVVTEACRTAPPRQCAGYMVVENDFVGYSYPTPQDGMRVLASHEFFHVIQKAYRADLPQGFSEATAVWITEQIYPAQTDYETFAARFFADVDRPLSDEPHSPADAFPYALGVWPQFLGERYGVEIVAAIFEELSDKGTSADPLAAIDVVLARDHQASLAEAFAEFALWNLLTGDRALADRGYQHGPTLPSVPIENVPGPHPLRISGDIAFLSAKYYRLPIAAGTRVTVTVERDEPKLALHLISGPKDAPEIVSGKVGDKEIAIDSQGEVLLVVAATADKDRHLPLSLAVRGTAPANPGTDAGVDPGTDAAGPVQTDTDSGGCAVGSGAQPSAVSLLALLLALRWRRRR